MAENCMRTMALAGMSRAEECQRNADECLQTAQRMSVKHERQRMLDMVSTPEQKCIGLPEQKCIKNADKRPPNWGPFSSGIRLGSDCPPACPSWRAVIGACSD